MKAALYVRVSTEEQSEEGYSLDAQRKLLHDYCESEDLEIAGIYEDAGFSGTNINRPAYRLMMEEWEKWDVLLVVKMDRLHRDIRNFLNMVDELAKAGKTFVAVVEAIDTTSAMGKFIVNFMQLIAELESEQIGERTYFGMEEKARTMSNSEKESRTMGFNAPYGYVLDNGILTSVPEELAVVREIFNNYLAGATMVRIAKSLNRRELLTKKGNPWNIYNMRIILHNPIYAGYMRWNTVHIKHFAQTVVSPEDFNLVQDLISSKIRDPKKKTIRKIPEEYE
jgi:DNA invertase Pin-like site-specific DNA recombinase